jgi:hypothetical protein
LISSAFFSSVFRAAHPVVCEHAPQLCSRVMVFLRFLYLIMSHLVGKWKTWDAEYVPPMRTCGVVFTASVTALVTPRPPASSRSWASDLGKRGRTVPRDSLSSPDVCQPSSWVSRTATQSTAWKGKKHGRQESQ